MGRFVLGAAALLALVSSPAAAERPWRPGGYTGSPRCAAMLHWASLEPARTAAERVSLRSVMLVACSAGSAAPPPPALKAYPPSTRFIRVRWSAPKAAGIPAGGHMGKKHAARIAGVVPVWAGTGFR